LEDFSRQLALIGIYICAHVEVHTMIQHLGLVSFILINLYLTGTSNGSLPPVICKYIAKLIAVYKANNGKAMHMYVCIGTYI